MKDFGKERPYREDLVTHLTVGEGITSIGENAFRNCTKLISAELPSSLKKINEDSFLDCVSLSDINIPFGVESIGSRAFKGCVSLIELQLPISVRILGEESFAGCKTNAVNRIHGERCFPWMQDSCHTFRSTVIRDHLNFRDIRTKPRCRKKLLGQKRGDCRPFRQCIRISIRQQIADHYDGTSGC